MNQSQPTAVPTEASANRRFSSEFDCLCACAGVELGAVRANRVSGGFRPDFDWEEFLHLAEHHGVLPIVARSLRAFTHELPTYVEQALDAAFNRNVRRNLWFASELVRICEQFDKNNLRVVPYKGPVLAEAVYGDVALRTFGDLDFLIAPADFDRAKEVLEYLRYHPSKNLSPALERYWLRNGYECAFDGAAGKYLLELQWRLLPAFYAVDLQVEDLLARSVPTPMAAREVHGLLPEDSFLVLCLHAAKHLWMRLLWVCDLAETIRTQPLDWTVLRRRAKDLGILRIVGVNLWLAQELLDASLSESALAIVATDPEVPVMGAIFADRLAHGVTYDFESTDYFRLFLKLRERRRHQVLSVWRLLWTPGEGDLASINLPKSMFPLYRAVRLVRLLRKLF